MLEMDAAAMCSEEPAVNHGETALVVGAVLLTLLLMLAGAAVWYGATRGGLVIGCPVNGGLCGVGMRT
ncbi:MAG TPA: hypothetical protein VH482_21910 [Thermomicrobiales bacterium]|jgi:hypothetical protein